MAEFLVIRPHRTDPSLADWVRANSSGALMGPVGTGTLAEAAGQAGQARVMALVPADDILCTELRLPVRGAAKMLQAIPYALEDRIAEDIDKLHFAIGRASGGGPVPVAAISRDRLGEWLEYFRASGIEPAGMFADSQAVPFTPNATGIVVDGDQALVRTIDGDGVTLSTSQLPFLFPGRLDDDDESASRTGSLIIYIGEQDHQRLQTWIDGLGGRGTGVEVRRLPDGPLPQLAASVASRPQVNLLQGEFARRTDMSAALWQPWRLAASLLLGLIVATLATQSVRLFTLKRSEARLDAAVEQVFRATFPEVKNISDPRALLQQQLRAMRGGGDSSPSQFLEILVALGSALAESPDTRLEGLSYRSNILDVQLRTPDVNTLDRIQREVAKSEGFQVEIQSANPSDKGVEGRLEIRRAGV